MKKPFVLVMIGLCIVLVGELHILLKPQPSESELRPFTSMNGGRSAWMGKLAPDFELETTSAGRFKLSENVGKKVLVLNFFATWCVPCRQEMPELNTYFEKHKNDSFLLLAVDAQETRDKVDGFFHEMKLSFPVGIDDGHIQKLYGVTAYPTSVLIGVDGRVQLYEAGGLPNADVAFDSVLRVNRQILASGKAITTEAYLIQTGRPARETPQPAKAVLLSPRAEHIAAGMDCPCGCDKRVKVCECHTAQNIKKTLAAGGFEKETDVEVMKGLNKKFCMGEM